MADPLDGLRTPIVPVAPDPQFAARLRRRIELLATDRPDEEDDMTEVLAHDVSHNGSRHGDVSYVTLAVPDAGAARRFYGTVLGWDFGTEPGGQAAGVIPQVGLWPASAWRGDVSPGAILSWRVDDIGEAVTRLRAAGGTATDPVEYPYGLQSDCTDGRGLRFWLHQLPEPGAPAPANGTRQGDASYVVLRVADLERGQRLFGELLGWRYAPGTAGVHVEGPVPMTGLSQGAPGAVLCWRVDDMDAAVERVRAAGGRPGPIEVRPYGREALCEDDQGVAFYLHELS